MGHRAKQLIGFEVNFPVNMEMSGVDLIGIRVSGIVNIDLVRGGSP